MKCFETDGGFKSELFEYISKKYNATIMDKNFQELESEGYVKNFTFIDGINFKIDEYIKNTENEISFEGTKWASGNGAIGFTTKEEKIMAFGKSKCVIWLGLVSKKQLDAWEDGDLNKEQILKNYIMEK